MRKSVIEFLAPAQKSAFPEEWYDLSSPDHFWFQWRLFAMLKVARDAGVSLDRPLRVLDIGAGGGALRDQLEACTPWVVDIADLNMVALEHARGGRGRTLCYDVLQPDESLLGSYDAVLLFDVLEHIPDTLPFVRSVLRHLKPGGHLLLNVPASQRLYGPYDVAAGHVRRYHRATLAAEFRETGLEILQTRYWGMLLVPVVVARNLFVRGSGTANASVRHGFEPPSPLADRVLRGLFRLETAVIDRPPFGSSLLLAGQYSSNSTRA